MASHIGRSRDSGSWLPRWHGKPLPAKHHLDDDLGLLAFCAIGCHGSLLITAATVRKHLLRGTILGTILGLTACAAFVDPFSGRGKACDILAIGKPASATIEAEAEASQTDRRV